MSASASASTSDPAKNGADSEKRASDVNAPSRSPSEKPPSPRGDLHQHKPILTHSEAEELAAAFAAAIPSRAFSMATLQGYLMAYKVRPREAVADAPAWVARKLGNNVIVPPATDAAAKIADEK